MNDTARGWVSVGLSLSIALNCLLVGVEAGRATHWFGPAAATPSLSGQQATPSGLSARIRLLPEDERRRFNQAMKPFQAEIREARAGVNDARQQFNAALLAEPYDAAAMTATLAELRRRTDLLQQRVHDATAQALGVLSAPSRAQLVEPSPR